MTTLHKDLHLSAEFLAFLRGGLYSQIALEGAADRLQASFLPARYVEGPYQGLEKLDLWVKELEVDELPILSTSWSSPDTFEAISAMGFMKELKRDLMAFAPIVDNALQVPNLSENREAAKVLAASIVRCASHRLAASETLLSVFLKLRAQDRAQQASAELAEARAYIQIANSIIETFANDAPYTQELCERLRVEASLIPCDLRAQTHDARIFLNVYAREFNFELAEIPPDYAQAWIDFKVPAVAAGYWHAYGFTPDDFARWASVGVRAAPLAAYWRRVRFDPEEAVEWIQYGLPPMVAVEWARAGFDAGKTVALLQRGISDPSQASKKSDTGWEDES